MTILDLLMCVPNSQDMRINRYHGGEFNAVEPLFCGNCASAVVRDDLLDLHVCNITSHNNTLKVEVIK